MQCASSLPGVRARRPELGPQALGETIAGAQGEVVVVSADFVGAELGEELERRRRREPG